MKQDIKPILIFWIFFITIPTLCFADVSVIVNRANKVHRLTQNEVRKIFRLKMTNWPSGNKIGVVNLPVKNRSRVHFSLEILKRASNYIKRYYFKMALSGKGQPPIVLQNEEEIKEYIGTHPDAISYINSDLVDNSVQVINIDGKKKF